MLYRMFLSLSVVLAVFTGRSALDAAPPRVQAIDDAISHEAWVAKVIGIDVLDAIPTRPPDPINERRPANSNHDLEWIEGYWAWSKDRNDYIWVSGVWRKPPPGRTWMPGFWKKFNEGYVWIRGFWSEKRHERDLNYVKKAPPGIPDEQVGSPPTEKYFWASGYWDYDRYTNKHEWIGGAWQRIDPNWVLVPAHWIWRPQGWVFVPMYWDYPVDQRGTLYSSVFIAPHVRPGFIYTPSVILDPWVWVERCYLCWPDYMYFYHWHWHCCPHNWGWCDCHPPWWGWGSWWAMPWHCAWDMWGWWGHPGWMQPWWMTMAMAQHIHGPVPFLLAMWDGFFLPFFITPNGMILPANFLDALGGVLPMVAPDQVEKIQNELKPPTGKKPLLPTGDADSDVELIKPNMNPGGVIIKPKDTVKLPTPPDTTSKEPEEEVDRRPPIRVIEVPEVPDYTPDDQWDPPPRRRPHKPHKPRWPNNDHDDHSGHDHGNNGGGTWKWPNNDRDDHSGHDHGNQGGNNDWVTPDYTPGGRGGNSEIRDWGKDQNWNNQNNNWQNQNNNWNNQNNNWQNQNRETEVRDWGQNQNWQNQNRETEVRDWGQNQNWQYQNQNQNQDWQNQDKNQNQGWQYQNQGWQ